VGRYRPDFNSVDALLVGYYEGHRLRFAGNVKAGFVAHTRRERSRPCSRSAPRPARSRTCRT
jgi:hypothetical protein